jgi:hypothetical protein
MISRHWKGLVKREPADRYVDHLRADTFPKLASLPGFIHASVLRRELPEGIDFQTVTLWESLKAIEAFAGGDLESAVVPPTVQAMMVHCDDRVTHYQVAHTFERSHVAGA